MKVLLIINSVAGKLSSHSALFDIIDTLCKKGYYVNVKTTQYRGHAKELAEKAYGEGFDLVVCCGGDGTMNEVLNGLLEETAYTRVPVGYIPAGSTNDFAATLGITTDIKAAAEAITFEHEERIDTGCINDELFFSYVASFGAFTEASYATDQHLKNSIGYLAYLSEGIKELSSIKPVKARIVADGIDYSGEYIFGSVSNSKSIAGIVKLTDDMVSIKDGLFEIMLVKNPKDIAELAAIILKAKQADFSSEHLMLLKAKEVTFHFEEQVDWSLDGEKWEGTKDVNIRNLHEAVRIYK